MGDPSIYRPCHLQNPRPVALPGYLEGYTLCVRLENRIVLLALGLWLWYFPDDRITGTLIRDADEEVKK